VQIGWAKAPASVEAFPPAIDGLQLTLGAVATAPGQPRKGPLMFVHRMLSASTIINLKSHPLAGKKITTAKIPLLIVYTLPGDATRKAFYVDVDAADLGIGPRP